MDRQLLDRLAAEARGVCLGQTIGRLLPRPGHGFTLVFQEDDCPVLDLATGPPRARFAATRLRLGRGAGPEPGVLARLQEHLTGHRLREIGLLAGDRILRLALDSGAWLILEAFGTAANIFVVGAAGRVEVRLRTGGRPGGPLGVGDEWRPPSGTVEQPLWQPPGSDPPSQPGLAAPVQQQEIDALQPLRSGDLVPRPDGPAAADRVFIPTGLLGDAVVLRDAWLSRHETAQGRFRQRQRILRRETTRLERLRQGLDREVERSKAHQEIRRQAEALLAGLKTARSLGDRVQVPDPYNPAGTLLEIPVDPGRDLPANAEAMFRRAGRLQRSERRVEEKRRTIDERWQSLQRFTAEMEAVDGTEALEELWSRRPAWFQRPARQEVKPVRQKRLEKDPRYKRIRRFVLSQDWHALVGGRADANDFLTFRLAAGHDFWLHTADYPGSHVVVRNPRRLPQPPAEVLRQAAGLAAHFSQAPGSGPVEVRWTQARYVRKGRGLPKGAVLLPRFATVTVQAALPKGEDPYHAP